MEKLLAIGAAVLGFLALAADSQSQTITSIQFIGPNGGGTPMVSGDLTGVYSVDNWNSTVGPGGYTITGAFGFNDYNTDTNVQSLVDSTGATSPVTYSMASYGNQGYGVASTGAANLLLNGGGQTGGTGDTADIGNGPFDIGNNPVVLTLGGLNPADTYSFEIYISGGWSEVGEGSLALSGGSTYYFLTPNGGFAANFLTTFQNGSSTTDFVAQAGGAGSSVPPSSYQSDYVEFTGITGTSSVTFTMTSLGSYPNGSFVPVSAGNSFNVGIAGAQVVDFAAPVPEPATVWSFALGLLGLAGLRFRRNGRGL